MASEPSFIFDGTVTAVGRSTEPLLKPGDLTAVVRVDAVARAPQAMQAVAGREITVQLRKSAKVGESARFSTRGLLYGTSLAVEEVAARKAVPAAPRAPAGALERPPTTLELDGALRLRTGLKLRVAEAASIVVGRVVSVSEAASGRKGARQSEHDPHWSSAKVVIDNVIKGRAARTVQVLFANSQDVMWYRAPKLAVGQRALLLLRKGAPGAPSKTANVVMDELDVQSAERAPLVASLL